VPLVRIDAPIFHNQEGVNWYKKFLASFSTFEIILIITFAFESIEIVWFDA